MRTCVFRKTLISLAALAALAAAAGTVHAAAAPANGSAKVVVGGNLIHVIRTPWGGHSPQERADTVEQRLIGAIARGPIFPKDITVGQVQDDWCVLLRGQRFLTADALTAKQQRIEPAALARHWAAHLRQVLPDLTQPYKKPTG